MALSGAYEQSITGTGGGWKLRLEWKAKQDKAANTSRVTAKLFWISFGNRYTVRSSANKTCNISIDGHTNPKTRAGLAALKQNQKKLVHTYKRTIKHDSQGKASFTLGAKFWIEVTLFISSKGKYYGSISIPTKTVTLDTIPMRIKRYTGSSFKPVSRVRRRNSGGGWTNATIRRRYNGSKWIDV